MIPAYSDLYVQMCLNNVAIQLVPYFQKEDEETMKIRSRLPSGSVDSGFCQLAQPSCSQSQCNEDIEEEIAKELRTIRQIPYRDYICHRCHHPGHMIQYCPTKNPSLEPTPYQGDRRSVGHFRCDSCHRQWKSTNTYANRQYKCKHCEVPVFPYKMYPIREVAAHR